ncbi:peptide ABC transporter substrate-binding protein [Rhizobium oryzicola]|uniref:Peptide ABC transporter substrate-binding protein n=1 Tax=Rhizobium oryzicola TaxID=1232668 RepID=A0ABT8SQU5_9HYPH|nr:peptide ABC transporter substrate-binding protein [Rhizobium oryzicola]MDO1580811.1 peptide ABC transporter substrate-binding protein [Rhizobium oryzicola]
MALVNSKLATALLAGTLILGASNAFAETVLRRGNSGEPKSLDYAHISINIEGFVIYDLFEGLVIHNAKGEIAPGAAESWKVSDDGTVYTFKIRDNAKWSDGSPVTAEDFQFAMRRIENPKTAAEYANLLYPIKNAEAVNKGKSPVEDLGVKVIDAKTLEITLERATPYFIQLLSHYTALPISKANYEKFGDQFVKPGNMVSNGAFKLQSHVPNDTLTVVKNENYWDASNVKIDKVIFYPIEDAAAAVRRFEAKELDVTYNFSADQIKRLRAAYNNQVHVTPSLSTYYYAFDMRQPPYDDIRVRRALSMAIDRDFLSNEIYKGAQLPTYSLVPDGMEGYGKPPQPDFASMSQIDREDKAVELLKEAGYGKGGKPLNIEIRYNTNTNHERVATAVANMWKTALGANVSLVNLDVASHYSYLKEGGKFNVARAGWAADYADPENFLALNVSTNKTFNYPHYNNPKYDELIKKSYEERDVAKRMELMRQAETMLVADQPLAPLMATADLWLVSDKVQGWVDNSTNNHLSKFLSVSK